MLGASAIVGSAEKRERLRALGCEVAVDYRVEDVAAALRQIRPGGFDVSVDYGGGAMVQTAIDAASIRVRIVCAQGGTEAMIDINELSRKQIRMAGVINRTCSLEKRIAPLHTFQDAILLPALEAGTITPIVDRIYAPENAEAVQDHMRTNTHFGKIALTV